MKLYWPCATRIRNNGETEPLFTYDGALSLDRAKEAFKTWEHDCKFIIKDCHIDVMDGDEKVEVIQCESWREKILHGLNSHGFIDGIPNVCGVTECPYYDGTPWCTHKLAYDAGLLISDLLKAKSDYYR